MTIKSTPARIHAPPQAGAVIEISFTDLLANGQAVGRSGGLVLFCFGPLPGERARVRVTSVKPKYAVAEMVELLERSPDRGSPFCPVFGTCGGCQVQHLSYSAQLAWKTGVVENTLRRIGGIDQVSVLPAIGMDDPRAYRNKMSLVNSRTGTLGFYKQRSHDLVPIDHCPIVMPALNAHIARLAKAASRPQYTTIFRDTLHIVERGSTHTGESVVTFTTKEPSQALRTTAAQMLAELPGAAGISNSFGLTSENAIIGRKQRLLAGREQIEERIGGLTYRVSGGSFFQVNVEIVARIFDYMRPLLQSSPPILDLYCGAGTFSLYFAQSGCEVLGVEENPQAVAEARENASLNVLPGRVRFVCGSVEDAVNGGEAAEALDSFRVAFLDPPRKGSDERTLDALARARIPAVWYLSCDPATLARDLKFLSAKGYKVELVQPFDMFPQTGHVEILVTMRLHDDQ